MVPPGLVKLVKENGSRGRFNLTNVPGRAPALRLPAPDTTTGANGRHCVAAALASREALQLHPL